MSEPVEVAKAINYHSDNLTHILHCDQCKEVHLWQAGIILGLLAFCWTGMTVAKWFANRPKGGRP